jgi:hypothetical protein
MKQLISILNRNGFDAWFDGNMIHVEGVVVVPNITAVRAFLADNR